jgi:hypothetical protein
LKNITLQGQGPDVDNNAALIQVNSGGTLELNDSVFITGNKKASGDGSGVYVQNHGTFTMSGGEIWGNTAGSGAKLDRQNDFEPLLYMQEVQRTTRTGHIVPRFS